MTQKVIIEEKPENTKPGGDQEPEHWGKSWQNNQGKN